MIPPLATDNAKWSGIPWRSGGRDRSGVDCVGLVKLFLEAEFSLKLDPPPTPPTDIEKHAIAEHFLGSARVSRAPAGVSPDGPVPEHLERGDVVFFRHVRSGRIVHVAVCLGGGRHLHILQGVPSRIENGLTLLARCQLVPAGVIKPSDAQALAGALSDPTLGWVSVILFVIGIAVSIASAFLMPKLPRLGNKYGRYGFDGLVTQTNPEIPLPDILGQVVVAGNAVYSQLLDKNATVTDPTQQAANKIVVVSSGPISAFDPVSGLQINGTSISDGIFFNGTNNAGVFVNPPQDRADAIDGTINGDTNVPSVTLYTGAYDISVPIDVRAQYDRNYPVHGLPGCAYLSWRLINSNKFQNFNLTCKVNGLFCRKFDTTGFLTSSNTFGATGDGWTVRFPLLDSLNRHVWDTVSVGSVTVGGVTYSPMDSTHQSGNVYSVNLTKGYIEFVTAPAVSAAIVIQHTWYQLEWTTNPASHLVYFLTEKVHGKGFDPSRIDWVRAKSLYDYCAANVTWTNADGTFTGARYSSNYSVDFRKPAQEHFQMILDACFGYLFLSNGQFVVKQRQADSSVFSFNESHIILSQGKTTFQSELKDRAKQANQVHLFYHTASLVNGETEVIADDIINQDSRAPRLGNDGVVSENLHLQAVTDQGQAERLAEMLLRDQVNTRWTVTFTTNIQGLALEPGDLIDITHSSQPTWSAKLFRIETLDYDPQDRLQITATEYYVGTYI